MTLIAYLAGKIAPNGWRNKIVKTYIDARDITKEQYAETYIEGLYVSGPFFIGCDHGCYHSRHGHGVGAYDTEAFNEEFGFLGELCDGEGYPASVVPTICESQIKRSNFIFAYINSDTCYGTLCEIGYAIGKGVPVAVMFTTQELKKKLWFVSEMSNIVFDPEGHTLRSNVDDVSTFSMAQAIAKILQYEHTPEKSCRESPVQAKQDICEDAKKNRREYYRKWRAEHPENVKASQEKYWAKKVMK